MHNFCNISNKFPTIFLSLIFRISVSQERLFFDLKVLWIAQKVHLGGNRRWLSLFIRFKQIWFWRGKHANLTDIASPVGTRISEEKLEKYQVLKRELKRIWKCREALLRTLNWVTQPEEMVTGDERGQRIRVATEVMPLVNS